MTCSGPACMPSAMGWSTRCKASIEGNLSARSDDQAVPRSCSPVPPTPNQDFVALLAKWPGGGE